MTLPQSVDVLVGQNKTGPYTLAYNSLSVDAMSSAIVVVDGVQQTTDAYIFDPIKGAITFSVALKSTSSASVRYAYDPLTANRNKDFTASPVTVALAKLAGTNLQMTTLMDYASGAGTSGSGQARTVYGLDRTTNLLGGGFTSKAMFSSSGTATNFGYKYGGDRNGFTTTLQRTEREFATTFGKPLSLADPTQKLSLDGRFHPMSYLGFGMTYGGTQSLIGGVDTRVNGMTVNLGGGPKLPALNFTRSEAASVPSTNVVGDKTTNVTTDKVDLSANLNKTTALTANGQRVATDAPGVQADTANENSTVALTTSTTNKKQQATVSLTQALKQSYSSVENDQGVQIKVQPAPLVTLSANTSQQHTAPTTIVTTPTPDTTKQVTAYSAQIGTGKAIELTGGLTNRSATPATGVVAPLDTVSAGLAVRPTKTWTVTGGYTENPETNGVVSDATRTDVGLKGKVGALDLGSGYSLTTLNNLTPASSAPDPQIGQITVSLGVHFDSATTLQGDYKDSLFFGNVEDQPATLAARGARLYDLGLTRAISPTWNLKLDGSVTEDKTVASPIPVCKASATLGAKF